MQDTHPHNGDSDPEIDAAIYNAECQSALQLQSGLLDGNDAK